MTAGETWRAVARATVGEEYAVTYAARFDALAADGQDVHGEAAFVAGLVPPGARLLDAGCGTGRVARRLAEIGYDVTGVDVDETMVAVARERSPDLGWHVQDLSVLDLGERFDLVFLAGNVVPFIEGDRLPAVARALARHLHPGGLVVCGFGLDEAHLPAGAPVVPLTSYDDACTAAGLRLTARHDGWDGAAFTSSGYAVSVHRLG